MYVDAYYTHNTIFVKCRKKYIWKEKKFEREEDKWYSDKYIHTHSYSFIENHNDIVKCKTNLV